MTTADLLRLRRAFDARSESNNHPLMSWSVWCGLAGAVAAIALPACGGRYERNGVGASLGGSAELAGDTSSTGGTGSGGKTTVPEAGSTAASGGTPVNRCYPNPFAKAPDAGLPAEYVSGEYEVVACGEEQPCAVSGQNAVSLPLPPTIRLTVQQSRALQTGTVTLHGTGEPLLDDRPFDAVFAGRSFAVELHGPLSAACPQNYSISLHYDFDAAGPRSFLLDFERLNSCSGNAGPSCQGSVQSYLGDAKFLVMRE